MVNMTHGANIHVRLIPLELFLAPCNISSLSLGNRGLSKNLSAIGRDGRSTVTRRSRTNGLFAADALDDFVGNRGGHLLVLLELHGVRRTSLGT